MVLPLSHPLRLSVLTCIMGLVASCTVPPKTAQETPPPSVSPATAPATAPKVVVTTTILCDMVRQIAQDTVNLTCLLKPGVDGHVYQPVPEDRKAIENANLILYSGYDFEPGLIKLIKSTANPAPQIAVAEKAVPNPLMGHEDAETVAGGHDHGQVEATADPHVWQNAANGTKMAGVVKRALIELAPDQKLFYTKNGDALEAELTQIHQWIATQIATIPMASRKLVTTHDAMQYFAAAYKIPVEGALQGLNTQEKPTAARVKKLVTEVKATNVPTIFAEVVVNPKLLETVAREAQVAIADRELYSDSLGEAGSEGDTYPKMLMANTRAITEGLQGKYAAFPAQK